MKRVSFVVAVMLLVFAVPAYAQVPSGDDLPEQTGSTGVDQDQYQPPGESTITQSIEEGLEDAGENAHEGDAVGGTESYISALSVEEPAPAAATPAAAPTPSEAYTELPDTGGFSPILVLVAGVLVIGGGLLFWFAASRR